MCSSFNSVSDFAALITGTSIFSRLPYVSSLTVLSTFLLFNCFLLLISSQKLVDLLLDNLLALLFLYTRVTVVPLSESFDNTTKRGNLFLFGLSALRSMAGSFVRLFSSESTVTEQWLALLTTVHPTSHDVSCDLLVPNNFCQAERNCKNNSLSVIKTLLNL